MEDILAYAFVFIMFYVVLIVSIGLSSSISEKISNDFLKVAVWVIIMGLSAFLYYKFMVPSITGHAGGYKHLASKTVRLVIL